MRKTAVSDYGFINAKLRSRISTILTEDFINSLINSDNIEAAVQVLSTFGYNRAAEVWNSTGDIQGIEFELFKNHIENYRSVMKNTDGHLRDFINVLTIKPEIENIKSVLRLWYGSKIKKRPVGYRASYIYRDRIYENINWDELVNAVDFEDISGVFSSTLYKSVFDDDSMSPESGLFKLETSLDHLYYRHIFEQSSSLNKSDSRVLKDIISTEIDLQNISWLIRYRHFYKTDYSELAGILIPGGHGLQLENLANTLTDENQEFSPVSILNKNYPELSALSISDKHNFSDQAQLFEQLLDETRKRSFTRILAGYPFTIGIVLVYFFMSEREQKFIASILNGKNYGFSADQIKGFS